MAVIFKPGQTNLHHLTRPVPVYVEPADFPAEEFFPNAPLNYAWVNLQQSNHYSAAVSFSNTGSASSGIQVPPVKTGKDFSEWTEGFTYGFAMPFESFDSTFCNLSAGLHLECQNTFRYVQLGIHDFSYLEFSLNLGISGTAPENLHRLAPLRSWSYRGSVPPVYGSGTPRS